MWCGWYLVASLSSPWVPAPDPFPLAFPGPSVCKGSLVGVPVRSQPPWPVPYDFPHVNGIIRCKSGWLETASLWKPCCKGSPGGAPVRRSARAARREYPSVSNHPDFRCVKSLMVENLHTGKSGCSETAPLRSDYTASYRVGSAGWTLACVVQVQVFATDPHGGKSPVVGHSRRRVPQPPCTLLPLTPGSTGTSPRRDQVGWRLAAQTWPPNHVHGRPVHGGTGWL